MTHFLVEANYTYLGEDRDTAFTFVMDRLMEIDGGDVMDSTAAATGNDFTFEFYVKAERLDEAYEMVVAHLHYALKDVMDQWRPTSVSIRQEDQN